MKQNFDQQEGKKNLTKLLQNIPNYSATINYLQVIQDRANQPVHKEHEELQRHGIADIEEVPVVNDMAYIQSVLVNI